MFENRVVRRIFGGDEVRGKWSKLHNVKLNDLHSSSTIVWVINSRRMRWVGHVACKGERRDIYRGLVGKPEGKRPLGIPGYKWEDNIKMDLQEVGCGVMDCIDRLRVGTVAGTCECGNEPSGSIKFREFLDKLRTS